MTTPPFRQSSEAILFACGGWFLFCVCDAMSKWLVGPYGPFQILAISGVIGTTLCGGWIFFRHGLNGFKTPKLKWYVARSATQSVSSFCAIHALATVPLSDFYGIIFLTPMLTALLATLVLGERIGIFRSGAIILGFIGVLVIAGPSFGSHNIGYLFVFISACCAACSAIFIRKIGRDPIVVRYAFFPFLFSVFVYVPLAVHYGFIPPATTLDLTMLLLYAPIAVVGVLGYSAGFARARDTAVITPFHYTQMIWGSLLGFVIFNHIPAFNTVIGSLIIICAGAIIIWRERVHHVQIASTAAETPI